MLKLKKINRKNVGEILKLEVLLLSWKRGESANRLKLISEFK